MVGRPIIQFCQSRPASTHHKTEKSNSLTSNLPSRMVDGKLMQENFPGMLNLLVTGHSLVQPGLCINRLAQFLLTGNYFLRNFYFLIQLVNVMSGDQATDKRDKTARELWQSPGKL